MSIINPGTEPRPGTLDNAEKTIVRFVEDLTPTVSIHREESRDRDGYWGYRLQGLGGLSVTIDVPGVDPDVTAKGEPWESPRLYVDGSSWLWGFALDAADSRLNPDDEDSW